MGVKGTARITNVGFPIKDYERVVDAARARDMSVSGFIRLLTLGAMSRDVDAILGRAHSSMPIARGPSFNYRKFFPPEEKGAIGRRVHGNWRLTKTGPRGWGPKHKTMPPVEFYWHLSRRDDPSFEPVALAFTFAEAAPLAKKIIDEYQGTSE